MTNQSPDLYALIIKLTAKNALNKVSILPTTHAHHAHAALFHILRHVDPALSQALHDIKGRKPFTISPLHGFGKGQKGATKIRAGQEGWLRVTLLDPTLFQTFIQYFLHNTHPHPTIRLGTNQFQITEILTTSHSHPLAGYTTFQHLYDHWQNTPANNNRQTIQLQFQTPTAFRLHNSPHRLFHVLPDPALVFGQLATYWDSFTGNETADAIREYASEHVVVARHNIQTHMFQYKKSKQVGFTGEVHFKILDREWGDLCRHLHRLADLALYTGLGSKTAQGMGQVNRMKD